MACRARDLCAQVGVQKARQLAAEHGLKYVAVHHMEAHALVARASAPVAFPFLCLLVSGGHNLLVIAHGVGRYSLLGSTLDDAVGAPFSLNQGEPLNFNKFEEKSRVQNVIRAIVPTQAFTDSSCHCKSLAFSNQMT